MNTTNETKEIRAVIVGLELPGQNGTEASIEELARLIDTAGGQCIAALTQNRESPDVRTCIGKGKIDELRDICEKNNVSLVVFDCELTPSQIRNIEEELGGPDVIDRSMLILDIFALHAITREGKLQVELAQLSYTAPRLIGKGKAMSRLEGRIGTRGPGESKLETDRRHIHRRMDALRKELAEIEKNRATMRHAREKSGIPKAAIAGYTNAGKSTLTNALCESDILAEDKLFATLDPTTRRFVLPDGSEMLLTDTVGFIRNLPHQLISAFRSTLEEVQFADFIIIVIDASDPEAPAQTQVTEQLLCELKADDKPRIYVFNKIDACDEMPFIPSFAETDGIYACAVSALDGRGLDRLAELLLTVVHCGKKNIKLFFPYGSEGELNKLYSLTSVDSVEYGDEGTTVTLCADRKISGMFERFAVKENE
ncbi:MAG: GTPase HflX [Clostridia bacterium]|nr:GTPase HflX [Clostridia bacterium]